MKSARVAIIFVLLIVASLCLTMPGWAKGPGKLRQDNTCTGPTITVGTVSACTAGSTVEVPITINNTAEQLSCSFSVSFDNTKLQYTGKTSGNMGASLLLASVSDINALGMVQPIVVFDEGGPASGTICKFKFTLLSDIADETRVNLEIGDFSPPGVYCGESGAVQCGTSTPQTWDDVVDIYLLYTQGELTWDDVIAAYMAYANQ